MAQGRDSAAARGPISRCDRAAELMLESDVGVIDLVLMCDCSFAVLADVEGREKAESCVLYRNSN